MSYLLDTHTLIWWATTPESLSPRVRAILEDENLPSVISVANIWELHLKLRTGKLKLSLSLEELVARFDNLGVQYLPITTPHVIELQNIPEHHRNPFDRILIAQAIVEQMTLLSKDSIFAQYPVKVVW
jgi:PIN domain nuclease of toxin-antitoxin system